MMLEWFVTGASLLAALAAWRQARRTARRLDQLSQMYWELKYHQGELRVDLDRITTPTSSALDTPTPPSTTAFVPLSSLKR